MATIATKKCVQVVLRLRVLGQEGWVMQERCGTALSLNARAAAHLGVDGRSADGVAGEIIIA